MKLGKILKKLLEGGDSFLPGPGRPEGPSQKNQHHFHKHPKSSKGVDYYHNFGGSQNWPYDDEADADLNVDLNEFFKFTTSMEDGAMGMGSGITQGSGAPRSYGKGKEPFGKKINPLDDQIDVEMHDNDMKLQQVAGRNSSRAKPISEFVLRGRERMGDMGYVMDKENPHASGDTGNKNPWTEDQNDDSTADLRALDEYATDDFSRWSQGNKATPPDEDLKALDDDEVYFETFLRNNFFLNFQIRLESLKDFFQKERERIKSKGVLNSLFYADLISYHPKLIEDENSEFGYSKRTSPMTEEEKIVLEGELKAIFDSLKNEIFDYFNELHPDDKKMKNDKVKAAFDFAISLIAKNDPYVLSMIKGFSPSLHYMIRNANDPTEVESFAQNNSIASIVEDFFESREGIEDKNIKNYNSIFDVHLAVQNVRRQNWRDEDEEDSAAILKKMRKNADYENLGTFDGWSVFLPLNKEASCVLGAGTKWCTAAVKSQNRYDEYSKMGDLVIFINKKNGVKYQGQIDKNYYGDDLKFREFKDAEDAEADLNVRNSFEDMVNNNAFLKSRLQNSDEIQKKRGSENFIDEAFTPESSGQKYREKFFEILNQIESNLGDFESLEKEKKSLQTIDNTTWNLINMMIYYDFNDKSDNIFNFLIDKFKHSELGFMKYLEESKKFFEIFDGVFDVLFNQDPYGTNPVYFAPEHAFERVLLYFANKELSNLNQVIEEARFFIQFYQQRKNLNLNNFDNLQQINKFTKDNFNMDARQFSSIALDSMAKLMKPYKKFGRTVVYSKLQKSSRNFLRLHKELSSLVDESRNCILFFKKLETQYIMNFVKF